LRLFTALLLINFSLLHPREANAGADFGGNSIIDLQGARIELFNNKQQPQNPAKSPKSLVTAKLSFYLSLSRQQKSFFRVSFGGR
jgi:hypothetical protein